MYTRRRHPFEVYRNAKGRWETYCGNTLSGESFRGTLAFERFLYGDRVDEQTDIGAGHSRGNHSIQDVLIRRSTTDEDLQIKTSCIE